MSEAVQFLDDTNFETTIANGVTLVDFYAEWCGPCKTIAPVIDELSKEFTGKAAICKLNVDQAQKTTASFGVTSIPTLIVFKDGKEVKRFVGVAMKSQLRESLNKSL